jgi:hypothetical protein
MKNVVALEDYEMEILFRLYDEGIIMHQYFAIEKVRVRIRWLEIVQKYRVKKSFSNVIRKLYNKGYINFGGKSGDVCSLSEFGAAYVREIKGVDSG